MQPNSSSPRSDCSGIGHYQNRQTMHCSEYKEKYPAFSALPLPREVWDTSEWAAWMEHFHQCQECADWSLYQEIQRRGFDPAIYPCVHIANQLTWYCEQHPNLKDCPDVFITYDERFDEYGIAHRYGDASVTTIQYCPWCGVRLPESKRDRWFEALAANGFDDPANQDIPDDYRTGAWYQDIT